MTSGRLCFATAIPALYLLAMAVLPGAASAQRVELLDFAAPMASAPAYVDGPTTAASAAALAEEFRLLALPDASSGVPVLAPPPPVPAWLRAPLASAIAGSGLPAPCPALPYRPRRDLTLATEARRARLFPIMAQAACEAGVPVGLLDALVVQESRYDASAVSPAGAQGLAQLMPGTARYLAVADPFDALANLRGGARYLREQMSEFGRVDLALAAYNAGPGRVRRRWAVPRITETRNYVSSVTRGWQLGVVRTAALLDMRPANIASAPAAAPVGTTSAPSGRAAQVALFRPVS